MHRLLNVETLQMIQKVLRGGELQSLPYIRDFCDTRNFSAREHWVLEKVGDLKKGEVTRIKRQRWLGCIISWS